MMEKNTLITPNRVYCEHEINSKKCLLEQIAQNFALTCNGLSSEVLFKAFFERERLGSSYLAHGIAIPHIRVSDVSEPQALFMQLQHPIEYEAEDNTPVDMVLALLVPSDADSEHLQLLARVARMFHDEELCRKLRHCHEKQSLYELLGLHLSTSQHARTPSQAERQHEYA